MPVVVSTMLLLLVLALGVMAAVALPQLREGKTVFSQAGYDQVDVARRRASALARLGNGSKPGDDSVSASTGGVTFGPDMPQNAKRARTPVGWTESTPGPRHAR